jgi:hypothetical protein
VIIFAQDLKPNKKIKSATDFDHTVSGVSSPMSLGDFSRTELLTNSKNDSVFSAEYEVVTKMSYLNLKLFQLS